MSMGPKQCTVVNALKFQVSENKASAAAPCPGCAGVFLGGHVFREGICASISINGYYPG